MAINTADTLRVESLEEIPLFDQGKCLIEFLGVDVAPASFALLVRLLCLLLGCAVFLPSNQCDWGLYTETRQGNDLELPAGHQIRRKFEKRCKDGRIMFDALEQWEERRRVGRYNTDGTGYKRRDAYRV